jgi:hypothetical protein
MRPYVPPSPPFFFSKGTADSKSNSVRVCGEGFQTGKHMYMLEGAVVTLEACTMTDPSGYGAVTIMNNRPGTMLYLTGGTTGVYCGSNCQWVSAPPRRPPSPPPSPPSPPPPSAPPVLFVVASGACTVASTATCFRSPNYPSAYGNSQACTITVNEAVLLSVTAFSTESGYDRLTVNGVQYSGTNGPGGVQVAAGSTITWTSDSSVTRTGFQICGTGTGAYSLSTVRGHCQFRGKRDGGLRVGRNAGGETLRSEVHVLTALNRLVPAACTERDTTTLMHVAYRADCELCTLHRVGRM